jgi:hypothetical protein
MGTRPPTISFHPRGLCTQSSRQWPWYTMSRATTPRRPHRRGVTLARAMKKQTTNTQARGPVSPKAALIPTILGCVQPEERSHPKSAVDQAVNRHGHMPPLSIFSHFLTLYTFHLPSSHPSLSTPHHVYICSVWGTILSSCTKTHSFHCLRPRRTTKFG